MNCGELGVRVTYRNKDMEPRYSKVYTLKEYTEELRGDLQRLVTDVENLCYAANGNKAREEWSDETFAMFSRIKHKLLDKAGDIGRLPENLVIKEPMSHFVARLLNEGGDVYGESRMGPNWGYSVREENHPLPADGEPGKL